VRIEAPGRRVEVRTVVLPHGGEIDLGTVELHAGHEVRGIVRGPDGRPVPGAHVTARPAAEEEEGVWGADTDDGGWFTLVDLPPGRYGLSPFDGEVQAEVEVGPVDVPDVALVTDRHAAIEVTVLDAQGRPASAVHVVAANEKGHEILWTETDGRAVFDRLEAGRWAVAWASARHERPSIDGNEVAHPASAVVEVEQGAMARVALRLPPLATISGRVRSSTGAIARGLVFLDLDRDALTDATGAFVFRHVEDGSYRLFLMDSEEAIHVRVASAKDQEFELRLPESPEGPVPPTGAAEDAK
jgi:hypothetical protein